MWFLSLKYLRILQKYDFFLIKITIELSDCRGFLVPTAHTPGAEEMRCWAAVNKPSQTLMRANELLQILADCVAPCSFLAILFLIISGPGVLCWVVAGVSPQALLIPELLLRAVCLWTHVGSRSTMTFVVAPWPISQAPKHSWCSKPISQGLLY